MESISAGWDTTWDYLLPSFLYLGVLDPFQGDPMPTPATSLSGAGSTGDSLLCAWCWFSSQTLQLHPVHRPVTDPIGYKLGKPVGPKLLSNALPPAVLELNCWC